MWSTLRLCFRIGVRISPTAITRKTINAEKNIGHEVIIPQILSFGTQSQETFVENKKELSLDEIVEELCGDNADLEKKLRVLMLEVEVMRQDGRRAPDNLNLRNWNYLLNLETKSQRIKYLTFLFKTERANENKRIKKEEKRKLHEETPKLAPEFADDQQYGLVEQSMFLRIRDSSMNNYDNYKALQAMMFGLPLVLDCSYDDNMVPREAINAAKQLTYVFGDNRVHRDPFDIHLCNVNKHGNFMKQFEMNVPVAREPWFPMHIHEQSYMDIFPKEKLVYLTPHCRDEIVEFDNEAIYIVGCMVDKTNNEPLSLAKAKRDGIKMAKLPLDRYLEWAPGSGKCLNINHMILILLDLKFTGDWEYSLRHVPKRKLMAARIEAVKKNVAKFNPKFIETLNSPDFKKRQRLAPRMYAGKVNMKSLFADDNKY